MGSAEAREGDAAFNVSPEVFGVGDVEVAGVSGAVTVVVANERCLVVVWKWMFLVRVSDKRKLMSMQRLT